MIIVAAQKVTPIGDGKVEAILTLLPGHKNEGKVFEFEARAVVSEKIARQLQDGHKAQVGITTGGPVKK
jgi:hypothetical protein